MENRSPETPEGNLQEQLIGEIKAVPRKKKIKSPKFFSLRASSTAAKEQERELEPSHYLESQMESCEDMEIDEDEKKEETADVADVVFDGIEFESSKEGMGQQIIRGYGFSLDIEPEGRKAKEIFDEVPDESQSAFFGSSSRGLQSLNKATGIEIFGGGDSSLDIQEGRVTKSLFHQVPDTSNSTVFRSAFGSLRSSKEATGGQIFGGGGFSFGIQEEKKERGMFDEMPNESQSTLFRSAPGGLFSSASPQRPPLLFSEAFGASKEDSLLSKSSSLYKVKSHWGSRPPQSMSAAPAPPPPPPPLGMAGAPPRPQSMSAAPAQPPPPPPLGMAGAPPPSQSMSAAPAQPPPPPPLGMAGAPPPPQSMSAAPAQQPPPPPLGMAGASPPPQGMRAAPLPPAPSPLPGIADAPPLHPFLAGAPPIPSFKALSGAPPLPRRSCVKIPSSGILTHISTSRRSTLKSAAPTPVPSPPPPPLGMAGAPPPPQDMRAAPAPPPPAPLPRMADAPPLYPFLVGAPTIPPFQALSGAPPLRRRRCVKIPSEPEGGKLLQKEKLKKKPISRDGKYLPSEAQDKDTYVKGITRTFRGNARGISFKQQLLPPITPKIEEFFKLHNPEGYWSMDDAVFSSVGVDTDKCIAILKDAGAMSLGVEVFEEIARFFATVLMLFLLRSHFPSVFSFSLDPLRKTETGVTQKWKEQISKAFWWLKAVDKRIPSLCWRLELGNDWELAANLLNSECIDSA